MYCLQITIFFLLDFCSCYTLSEMILSDRVGAARQLEYLQFIASGVAPYVGSLKTAKVHLVSCLQLCCVIVVELRSVLFVVCIVVLALRAERMLGRQVHQIGEGVVFVVVVRRAPL